MEMPCQAVKATRKKGKSNLTAVAAADDGTMDAAGDFSVRSRSFDEL